MVIKKTSLFSSKQRQRGERVAVFSFWIGFIACMVDWLQQLHSDEDENSRTLVCSFLLHE